MTHDERLEEVTKLLLRIERDLLVSQQGYLTIRQAAAFTGLSTKHIRRAMTRGELVCYDAGLGTKRKVIRIARKDIVAWMESRQVRQAPAKVERDSLVERFFPKKSRAKAAA